MIKGKPTNTIKEIPIFNSSKEIANLLRDMKNPKERGHLKNLLLATIYSTILK